MDYHDRRKLVAGIVLLFLILTALIGEAMQDRMLRNRALGYLGMFGAGLIAVILFCFLLLNNAFAHDHNHPELDNWFMSLHAKSGAWCCDGKDALIADWEMQGEHYRVRIDGEWVDVPDQAVVDGPNKVGGARVWPTYQDGKPAVRCFLPGSLT